MVQLITSGNAIIVPYKQQGLYQLRFISPSSTSFVHLVLVEFLGKLLRVQHFTPQYSTLPPGITLYPLVLHFTPWYYTLPPGQFTKMHCGIAFFILDCPYLTIQINISIHGACPRFVTTRNCMNFGSWQSAV